MKKHALTLSLAAGLAASSFATAADTPSQADRVTVGQEAPAFSLAASDGGTYTLADLRGEKNLVLVFFRGSW
jgi:cytochrome oxidase Cu insertion factor (SCO1/SenC/PrrC family)